MRAVAGLWLVICVAAVTLFPTRATAHGAVAEAQGRVASATWVLLGRALNAGSPSEAETAALNSCNANREANGLSSLQCRIVATFSEKCLATAKGRENSLALGWGIGNDPQAAERDALARCRERGGPGNECSVVRRAECDKAPAPDLTPVVRTVAAVAVTSATGVLLWNIAGGAAGPMLNIIAGIFGLAGMLYLFVSFMGGGVAGDGTAQNDVGEAIKTARTATYVSVSVAIGSAIAVVLTLLWASRRLRAMQVAMDRMKSGASRIVDASRIVGASRIFAPRSSTPGTALRTEYGPATGRAGGTRSGSTPRVGETRADIPAGTMLLRPKAGGAAIVLSTGLLNGAGVVIGRHPSCNAVVNDEEVSGRHARIFKDRDGTLRIEDLGSTNGTWRDGVRIKTASLRPGSTIRLGGTEYLVPK